MITYLVTNNLYRFVVNFDDASRIITHMYASIAYTTSLSRRGVAENDLPHLITRFWCAVVGFFKPRATRRDSWPHARYGP
ncbi:MAG: hypothetical protein ACJ746_30885 [Bryobacteraceae bacterium]